MTLERDVPLRDYTTLRIGGPAQYFIRAETLADIRDAVLFAQEKNLPLYPLGGGSNILVSDRGYAGVILRVELRGLTFEEKGETVIVTAQAGEEWDSFVETCTEKGLWGVENLSGIPGTVGATPVQNVGAYGVEVENLITHVTVWNRETKRSETLSRAECLFSYRGSIFKTPAGEKYIVTAVSFSLSKVPQPILSYRDVAERLGTIPNPSLAQIRETILSIRAKKFPDLSLYGTAGSFFKNPILEQSLYAKVQGLFPAVPAFPLPDGAVKISLAWILDQLGVKDMREGDVSVFPAQPLVIVNNGNATADAVAHFADTIQERVYTKTGIVIEREVRSL